MKRKIGLTLFALCSSLMAAAQVFPTDSGGCNVSPSGVTSCNWLSAMKKDDGSGKQNASGSARDLSVTRFHLSSGALFKRMGVDEDNLIIGLGSGELLNEAKSPPVHISVGEGLIFLMPKEEPFSLRNVGKQDLDILVVLISPAVDTNKKTSMNENPVPSK